MSLRIFGRFLQATGPLARIPSLQYSVCIRTGRHYSTKLKEEPGIKDDSEQFSGYIPPEKLCIRYCRSSGPGGQHVNKTNSKVEIRFHVESADWIPDSLKEKLIEREKTRITNSGYLIVTSEKTRKQILNQADCIDKIRQVVFLAAKKPRELAPEEIQEIEARKARAKRRILREKRIHSLKKYNRTMGCVNVE